MYTDVTVYIVGIHNTHVQQSFYQEFVISPVEVAGDDTTMSLIELCRCGDLEGVKAALQRGANVNGKDEDGLTGLMWAVRNNHNSVVALLLNTPNIDVNLRINRRGWCALREAVRSENNEALKMLLDLPNIDMNILNDDYDDLGGAVHRAVGGKNIEGLKLLLSVPSIDVNIVTIGELAFRSALHVAVERNNIEALHYRLRSIKEVQFGFAHFVSHFIRVQIFQIDFPLILSTSKYFR